MVTATEPEPRSWRLVGYRGKHVIHEETCAGDDVLNVAVRALERRPDITKIAAKPESLSGGREVVVDAPVVLPPGPPRKCAVCELPRAECERRAPANGHDFEPGAEIFTPK